jgi:hypothetical protein
MANWRLFKGVISKVLSFPQLAENLNADNLGTDALLLLGTAFLGNSPISAEVK